jgi:hypothetical protein
MRPVEVRAYFDELGWDFDGYQKFLFVRNPWARILSLYRQINVGEIHPAAFGDWLGTINSSGEGGGGQDSERWRRYGSYSLSSFARDFSHKELVDTTFRLEDIEFHLRPFLRSLGMKDVDDRPLPHSNRRSEGEPYFTYFNREGRDRVAKLYREDIDRFGYVFGG